MPSAPSGRPVTNGSRRSTGGNSSRRSSGGVGPGGGGGRVAPGPPGGTGTGTSSSPPAPRVRRPSAVVALGLSWRRQRSVHAITDYEDLSDSCNQTLQQLNKRLARFHYLLMFIGYREKSSRKLLDEIQSMRRKCLESVWHVRDKLLPKFNRRTMQGQTVTYVRALTDCLEMYLKELAILHGIHVNVGVLGLSKSSLKNKPASNKASNTDDLATVRYTEEKTEVTELLQSLSNKVDLENMAEEETNHTNNNHQNNDQKDKDRTRTPAPTRFLCCMCTH